MFSDWTEDDKDDDYGTSLFKRYDEPVEDDFGSFKPVKDDKE